METIKECLLLCILLVYPVLPGILCDFILKKEKKYASLASAFVSGAFCYAACFALLSVRADYAGWELPRFEKALLVITAALPVVSTTALFLPRFRAYVKSVLRCGAKQEAPCEKPGMSIEKQKTAHVKQQVSCEKPGPSCVAAMIGYALIAIYYILGKGFYISETFSVPEQVLAVMQTGDLAAAADHTALFYVLVCKWSGVSASGMLFRVIPYVVLLLAFCVMQRLATACFGREAKAGGIFLLMYALIVLCGNEAYMNPSYGLLHFPYEGMTFVSDICIPYVFMLFLDRERKWYLVPVLLSAVAGAGIPKGGALLCMEILCLFVWTGAYSLWKRRRAE